MTILLDGYVMRGSPWQGKGGNARPSNDFRDEMDGLASSWKALGQKSPEGGCGREDGIVDIRGFGAVGEAALRIDGGRGMEVSVNSISEQY